MNKDGGSDLDDLIISLDKWPSALLFLSQK